MLFVLHFLIFALGDAALYYMTNTIYGFFLPPTGYWTQLQLLTPIEWIYGNIISYTLLHYIYSQQIGLLYFNIRKHNIIYTIISPILYFYLQDLLFYITHRLAHCNLLYRYIHYDHHMYKSPITWVSRLSHWVDSNLENVAFIIPALIIPMNIYIWFGCLIFTYAWATFLHDSRHKITLSYLNDNTDHALHHYYGKKSYNFAYYFNHWDKFFGTYKY